MGDEEVAIVSPLRFSLVTPSLNQGAFIERTIRSVLTQRGDFSLEYQVRDGSSTDQTLDILRRYEGRLHWWSEPDNGKSEALNKGFRHAAGDVIGWVNSDDVLRPGTLQRVAAVFQARPDVLWLHGRCDVIDAHDRVIRRWISAYKDWCCRHYSYERLLTENFISQVTVFWRRDLMARVGYLDERLRLSMDYDLWLRFGRVAPPFYLAQTLACFRWHAGGEGSHLFVPQMQESALIARRHAPNRPWLDRVRSMKDFRTRLLYQTLSRLGGMLRRPTFPERHEECRRA